MGMTGFLRTINFFFSALHLGVGFPGMLKRHLFEVRHAVLYLWRHFLQLGTTYLHVHTHE